MFHTLKIVSHLLSIVVVALVFGNQTIHATQNQTHPRILKSASELDYPPFAIAQEDGSADGFSVELLKAVVRESGHDITFSVGPWHEVKQQLDDGRVDVLPLVSYSEDRDTIYDFTVPYLLLILIPVLLLLAIAWVVVLRREIARKTKSLKEEIIVREEAQRALGQSEQLYRNLYEHAPLPYQSLNDKGHFLEVNQAWLETMGGFTKAEVMGKSFADFLPPEWQELFRYNFPRFKDKGEILGVEFEMLKSAQG